MLSEQVWTRGEKPLGFLGKQKKKKKYIIIDSKDGDLIMTKYKKPQDPPNGPYSPHTPPVWGEGKLMGGCGV